MQLTPDEEQKLEELCALSFDFARQNDAQSLAILLQNGLNPNLSNHRGDTLLMLASYHNSIDCVRLLLAHHADVDKVNDKNLTPLAGVCFKGYVEVARMLLQAGANPDKPNAMGLTPMDFAVKTSQKKLGFFKKLWVKW